LVLRLWIPWRSGRSRSRCWQRRPWLVMFLPAGPQGWIP